MKKFIVLLILSLPLFAQNNFKLDFDYAQFRYDSTKNYFEIYYLFDKGDLTVNKNNGDSFIEAIMHIQIQNLETDELIVNKDWVLKQPINITDNGANNSLLGSLGFVLNFGKYSFTISIEDAANSNISKEYTENINVLSFFTDNFAISDIELASRIINENADKNSIFYKNTLEVFPNPSFVYSNTSPILFYYAELYNLNKTSGSSLTLKKSVFNSSNLLVYEKEKILKNSNESLVEVGLVNLIKYPTDSYTLALTLADSSNKNMIISSKKFFLVNPGVEPLNPIVSASSEFISSQFGVYSMDECDDLFAKSKIIALDDEIDQYEDLDSLNQKREFLFNFWKKRDNYPTTKNNEYMEAYFARVDVANARFRTMSNPGYETERGRVYLTFGEPDQIDRFPNETNTKPYEVWSYHQIEGGVVFIFGDLTGFNFYELLHSTKRGEIQDPNWQRRIATSNSNF